MERDGFLGGSIFIESQSVTLKSEEPDEREHY